MRKRFMEFITEEVLPGVLAVIAFPFYIPLFLWEEVKYGKKRRKFLADFYGDPKSGKYEERKNIFFFKEIYRGEKGRVKVLMRREGIFRGQEMWREIMYQYVYDKEMVLVCPRDIDNFSWWRPDKFVRLEDILYEKKVTTNYIPLFLCFPELKKFASKGIYGHYSLDKIVLVGEEAQKAVMVILNIFSEIDEKVKKAKERVEKAGGVYNFLLGEILSSSI